MFCKNKKTFAKKLKGFLIAEVLVASFLLTVGLTATTALIASSLKYSLDSQDTIVATMLAQEGVELVRNVRDNGFISTPANPFSVSFSSANKHCRISYNSNMECQPSVQSSPYYSLQYTGGFYKHTGVADKFSRYIYVVYDNTAQTAVVRNFVYWGTVPTLITTGVTTNCTVINKCVFTEIILTNWK